MHICIILVDALRADHLGCYGYNKDTSPNIDSIAGKGIFFENAISQSNWTLPSLYSLISGRYPMVLNISWFDEKINRNFVVLPELLSEKGHHTAIFSNFGILLNASGFSSHFKEKKYIELNNNTKSIFSEFIERHKDSFLIFHIGEYVHEPFKVDKKNISQFLDDEYQHKINVNSKAVKVLTTVASEDSVRQMVGKINKRIVRLNRGELHYLLSCYDAGIYYIDKFVGELYNILRGKSNDFLFILTADHGQAFFEHGFFGHGNSLYNEMIHVPLIIGKSKSTHRRVLSTVQLIDIFPTIMDLIGDKRDLKIDGKTFSYVFKGGDSSELDKRFAVSEGYPNIMISDGDYKLISSYSKFLPGDVIKIKFSSHQIKKSFKHNLVSRIMRFLPDKLYHIKTDKKEKNNLRWKQKDIYLSLKIQLAEIIKKAIGDGLPSETVNLDDEIKEQLKSLGYL